MPDDHCPYCDPYQSSPGHLEEKFDKVLCFIYQPFSLIESVLNRLPAVHNFFDKLIIQNFIKLFLNIGLLREADVFDFQNIPERTMVLAREARERGIAFNVLVLFNRPTKLFCFEPNGKKLFFETLPVKNINLIELDDKMAIKKIMARQGLPHAPGKSFWRAGSAIAYAGKIGYPVVVKPRSGSLSKHVTTNIRNEQQMREAIRAVKIICSEFIVEKYLPGKIFRATVTNGRLSACCEREAPNVISDGSHTIEELINIKNSSSIRKTTVTQKTLELLEKQGLSLAHVSAAGKKIFLHEKIILAGGADIHDKTDQVCDANKKLFELIARLSGAILVGIDFIGEDIGKPYSEQSCAILEANSLPYIDMHHHPTTGEPKNVAGELLNCLLNDKTE